MFWSVIRIDDIPTYACHSKKVNLVRSHKPSNPSKHMFLLLEHSVATNLGFVFNYCLYESNYSYKMHNRSEVPNKGTGISNHGETLEYMSYPHL